MEKEITNVISRSIKIFHYLYGILSDIFFFYFQPLINLSIKKPYAPNEEPDQENLLSRGDIKMVMERLGIFWHPDDKDSNNNNQEIMSGANELSRMFEEEPSLDELKEAFDIFDNNKDGFIDGTDLQRVLGCLGFNSEESEVEKCRRMIMATKMDGDDPAIDFHEFVRFMEKCFC